MYTHTQNGKEKKIKRGKCHKSINNDQSVSLLSPISKIVSNSPHTYTYYGRLKWMDGIFLCSKPNTSQALLHKDGGGLFIERSIWVNYRKL